MCSGKREWKYDNIRFLGYDCPDLGEEKQNTPLWLINQSPKQDRDKDEVYLKTSPSQSSAHGVSHDLGWVLAHTSVARQQPCLYRNKVTTCILYDVFHLFYCISIWRMTLTGFLRSTDSLPGHSYAVQCALISGDRSTGTSASKDEIPQIWDTKSRAPSDNQPFEYDYWESCMAISGDRSRIVSCYEDENVRVWDTKNGTPIGSPLLGLEETVWQIAICGHGRTIVSCLDEQTVLLWNAKSGALICDPLLGHNDDVKCVAINGDGSTIVSGSKNRSVWVWNARSGTLV